MKEPLLSEEQKARVTSEMESKWFPLFEHNARKSEFSFGGRATYYVQGFMIASRHVKSSCTRELFLAFCYHMEKRKLEKIGNKFGI
jgi:hypothetical protein